MVGIAAGVPAPTRPERHVRLGDVVVSSWGIVDYHHQRVTDGRSELRQPFPTQSPLLSNAIMRLRAGEEGGQRPWQEWLEPQRAGLPSGYQRPPDSTDVLHAGDDPERVIAHPPNELSGHLEGYPKVHYGRIGSADLSLRDARKRDELAARHDVLAFEMEAAGVGISSFRDGLEWLVVRGISDYGDSATDERWRRYAALTAAAYTRALLGACPAIGPRGGHAAAAPHATGPGPLPTGTPPPEDRGNLSRLVRVGAVVAVGMAGVVVAAATVRSMTEPPPEKSDGSVGTTRPPAAAEPDSPCSQRPTMPSDLPRRQQYVLKESNLTFTNMLDKVDLDTGHPGHGSQLQGDWNPARDGRLADLIVERSDVHTACQTASLLLAGRGAETNVDGCRAALAGGSTLTNSIKLADLAEGDVICAKTDEGLIAHIEIASVRTSYPASVTIETIVDKP